MLSKFCYLLSKSEEFMAIVSSVKVSKRYQISVPAAARHLLNINSGDRLLVDSQDGILVLVPEPENYTQVLSGLHKEIWDGLIAQEYINQERSAWTDSQND